MKMKSCYSTTSHVHLVTKSAVLRLCSEHSGFFIKFFVVVLVKLHFKEILFFFSTKERTKIKVRSCFVLLLLSFTTADMYDSLEE